MTWRRLASWERAARRRVELVRHFSRAHIERALEAAKNPQLKMKLQTMPIPLTAEMVDEYMGPVLEAAQAGDLALIKTPPA